MTIQRYLTEPIYQDLQQKMVFVGGPRQVGKTTLAKKLIAGKFSNPAYYNWDNRKDRIAIMEGSWPGVADLIILDEIHKYKKWKSHLKGEYDSFKEKYRFLVTGSARLDIYRKGGDSLQGRYHYYRLHPLSLSEVSGIHPNIEIHKELSIHSKYFYDCFLQLDKFGGFPEPFMHQSEKTLRRWHNEKIERMFREDILDVEHIIDIGNMKLLSDLLPRRVGSPLSLNSIREDLNVSHKAVSRWISILESFYYCFRIFPYQKEKIRALKKEPKLYLLDWSEVDNEAIRFENMIATHLLKFINFLYDYDGQKAELWYLKNVDKKEVDFFVTISGTPWFAIETKLSDTDISKNLLYYQQRLKIPYCYQVVKKPGIDILTSSKVRIISADKFLAALI